MGTHLGLEHGKVRLVDADPHWPTLFAAEIERIRPAIGQHVVTIEHFGSTAIPGIKAKPILDIMLGLRRFEDGNKLVEPLVALGYEYVGTGMVPDDHLFGLGKVRTCCCIPSFTMAIIGIATCDFGMHCGQTQLSQPSMKR